MPSYSQTIIIGHLGRDPEVRYLQNGTAVCGFSVATTESWKDKSGEWQERTEWHNVTAWGKTGENAAKWLKKGSLATVIGKNRTEEWTDKDGNKRTTTKIQADKILPMDPKRAEQPAGQSSFEDDIPF